MVKTFTNLSNANINQLFLRLNKRAKVFKQTLDLGTEHKQKDLGIVFL